MIGIDCVISIHFKYTYDAWLNIKGYGLFRVRLEKMCT